MANRLSANFQQFVLFFGGLALAVAVQCAEQPETTAPAAEAPTGDNRAWVQNVDSSEFKEADQNTQTDELKDLRVIANSIQSLKSEVITLNKDLQRMEEKLLFPSNTRYSVFVSLTTGQFFKLESIKLKIDGKLVATHVYSDKQRVALQRGGIHKLYVTNMNEGIHNVTAFFSGLGQDGRPYKRAANLEFEKSIGSEFLELAIIDDGSIQEPKFTLKRW
ncbi:hypothetical protein P886_3474 [Alteromonadaceae bacterium 2753L.S.0a.02]|nr:hypothetical protein P886_3474 [Alteromonadaceae bacterium 2753L.S.0a.02]